MTSRILTVMILLGGFGLGAASAFASQEPSNDQVNQMFVDDLNDTYHNLNLKLQPGADSDAVYNELFQLIDYQKKSDKGQQGSSAPNLKHLVCSSPTCGGCSRGPC